MRRGAKLEDTLKNDQRYLLSEWDDDEKSVSEVSRGSSYKARWKCSKGHRWRAAVSNRVRGKGCPYCSGRKILEGFNDLATTHPDIAAQWNDSRDVLTVSAGSNYKAQWECGKGHRWSSVVASRITGIGCPYCSGKRVSVGENDLATTHSYLVEEWDDKREIETFSRGSHYRAQWECHKGHTWKAAISERTSGKGCPYCSNRRVWAGYNDLSTTHPHLLQDWDDDKEITKFSHGSEYTARWKCPIGHTYYQKITYRSKNKIGCSYCSGREALEGFNDLATTHPELVKEWDDERSMTEFSKGSSYKAQWKCAEGHIWKASVNNRVGHSHSCPSCSGRRAVPGETDLLTTYPWLAQEWDDERSMTEFSHGSHYKARWKCLREHTWKASPYTRTKGHGCPKCSSIVSSSEQEILEYIRELLPKEVIVQNSSRKIIPPYELDIYIPERGIAVEFNGIYWHTEGMGKDKWYHHKKWKMCRDKGIDLFTVWEGDYKEAPEAIRGMLLSILSKDADMTGEVLEVQEQRGSGDGTEDSDTLRFRHYSCSVRDAERPDGVMSVVEDAEKQSIEITHFVGSSDDFSKLLNESIARAKGEVRRVFSTVSNDYPYSHIYSSNGFRETGSIDPRCRYGGGSLTSLIQLGHQLSAVDDAAPKSTREDKERLWDCGYTIWEFDIPPQTLRRVYFYE